MPTPNFQWTCLIGPDPKLDTFVKSVPEKRALNALEELGIVTARGLLARIDAARAEKDGPIWNAEIVGIGEAMALRFEQGAKDLLDGDNWTDPTAQQVVDAIDGFWTTASKAMINAPIFHHSTRLIDNNTLSIWFFANKGSVRRFMRHDPRVKPLPPMTRDSYAR